MNEQVKKTERIWLSSPKGGVGVSFAAVNLALALCRRSARVLLVDGSPFCRALDTVLSCAEDVIYDISDLAADRVDVQAALLRPLGEEGPYLLPGAFSPKDALSPRALTALLDKLQEALALDYILVDAPMPADALTEALGYDRILLLSDTSELSLRAVEAAGVALHGEGAEHVSLLINRFSLLPPRESGQKKAIFMLDAARLPLAGIIPTVGELTEQAGKYRGTYPLLTGRAFRREAATLAFDNLAARLAGARVPLFAGISAVRFYRKKLLY